MTIRFMKLEDYFNFLATDDIRLKGTRIGIETILYDFIYKARTPEEIVEAYPSLNLEQVYATILYYFHEQEQVNEYLEKWLEWGRKMREKQAKNPPPMVERLRKLKKEILAQQETNDVTILN